jgi:hypothetical protein
MYAHAQCGNPCLIRFRRMHEACMKKIAGGGGRRNFGEAILKYIGSKPYVTQASLYTARRKSVFRFGSSTSRPLPSSRNQHTKTGFLDATWMLPFCRWTQVERAGDLEKGGDDVCAVGVRMLYGVYMERQISHLLHRARRGGEHV